MRTLIRFLTALIAIAFVSQSTLGQDSSTDDKTTQDMETTESSSQSGYDDIAEFGGPESVGTRLKENDAERESIYRFDNLQNNLAPYFDWKRNVKEDHGVAFGTSFYLLYQKASDALPGEDDDALGHIFRQQGSWTIFQQADGDIGRFAWRIESRSHIGGFQAPGSLGGATGIRTLADRPYTVFNGHVHAYKHIERHGRDYIRLATTGGEWFPDRGRSMDQVVLVTVDNQGADIANLLMSGILDKTGHIPLDGDEVCFELAACPEDQ